MTTTWPAYEGSVHTSCYRVCLVLTTRSPPAATGAPKAMPGKTVSSSSASNAGPRSPIRGSTTALERTAGGAITRRRGLQQKTHPPSGRGGRGYARTSGLLRRPHGTGTPASQDRPSKDAGRVLRDRRGVSRRDDGRP